MGGRGLQYYSPPASYASTTTTGSVEALSDDDDDDDDDDDMMMMMMMQISAKVQMRTQSWEGRVSLVSRHLFFLRMSHVCLKT